MKRNETTVNPGKEDFLNSVRGGMIPPVYSEIQYADPAVIYESLSAGAYSVLLESVKGAPRIARYSFIAFEPYLSLKAKDREVTVQSLTGPAMSGPKNAISSRPPLHRLRDIITAYPQKALEALPPFQGGAVGLLSYDFVRYIEDLPRNAVDDLGIPDVHFLMVDRVIAFDHADKKAWVVISPGAREMDLGYRELSEIDWDSSYDAAEAKIDEIKTRIQKSGCRAKEERNRPHIPESCLLTKAPCFTCEMSKEQYMNMVKKTKEYIAAGDIFQANLSQRISAPMGNKKPWDIYMALREINPSPFAAYADFGDYQIVSSSPERLIKVSGNTIETRPIAGTRPRGQDRGEDELLRADLLLNEKERAEHIMLIDLERNDMGKVSEYGKVFVDELMITEDYSHVIHIVSNVKGTLRKGKTCFDVISAAFPGGTITGVPKVRCMEIIDELEPVTRGPYTGSLGYIGFSGDMDLNIIIRTFVIKNGTAYVQAGAGIVADSDPEKEYYETLKKAEALLKTLMILEAAE